MTGSHFNPFSFSFQGKALNAVANQNVKVIVVGNPCNTKYVLQYNQILYVSVLQWCD